MKTTTPKSNTGRKASTKKTSVELDAELVAKIRASLRAINRNETIEEFIEDTFSDCLTSLSGVFEGLISSRHEHRRPEMESKLERIRDNDRRLVHPEPLPRNVFVHDDLLIRLDSALVGADSPKGSGINALIEYGLNRLESGAISIKPN